MKLHDRSNRIKRGNRPLCIKTKGNAAHNDSALPGATQHRQSQSPSRKITNDVELAEAYQRLRRLRSASQELHLEIKEYEAAHILPDRQNKKEATA